MSFTTPTKGAGAFFNSPASMAPSSSSATPGGDSAYGSMADGGASAFTKHMQDFLRGNGIDAAVAEMFTAEEILANAREMQSQQPAPAAPPAMAPSPPSSAVPAEAPRRAEVTSGAIPYGSLPSFQKRKRDDDEDDGDYAVTKKQRTKKPAPPTTTNTTISKAKKAITKKTAGPPPPPPKVKDISYDIPATAFKDLDWSEVPTSDKAITKRKERIDNFPPAALTPAADAISNPPYHTQKYINWLQGHVEHISFRLAAVTVMLHRADYTTAATKIGQFTVDLLGPEIYKIALTLFLKQTDDHDVWLHAEMAIADAVYYLRGGEKKATRGDLFEESEKLRLMARGMGMMHGILGEMTWTEKRGMATQRQIEKGQRQPPSDDEMLEEL